MTGILKVDQIQNIEDASSVKVNRTTSDGTVLDIQKDGTSVGSIGSSPNFNIQRTSGSGFNFGATNISPLNSGVLSDNTIDLGFSIYRWNDLYLGGNIYLGGTGSANALNDYEEGTWTPVIQASGTAFSSIGFSQQIGYYTKIGRMVIAQGIVAVNSLTLGSASGNIRIGSLPFTASNTSLPYGSAMDYANNIDFNGGGFGTINIGLQVVQNSTTASPTRTRNLNGADGVPVSYLRSNSSMNFCCIYNTDS